MVLALHEWACLALESAGQRPQQHHALLLKRLSEVSAGAIDRLMVLMPPGSGKSTYGSVLFPAWFLAVHPKADLIAASHTDALATHFGRQVRNCVIEHGETLGYGLARDERAAGRFRTDRGGRYFSAGVRGPITGRRADLVLIDDPVKSHAEADSALARESLWEWYRSELTTRLKPGGRIVLIMTRWHQDDLGGRLLREDDGWVLLRLPALAEPGDPLARSIGSPLWPEIADADSLRRTRTAVGTRNWHAMYQQAPRASEGALFVVDRIATVDAVPAGVSVRAWDLAATAAGDGRDPDWTVGLKLCRDAEGALCVTDVVRLRGGPAEVEAKILATANADGANVTIGLPQDPGQAGKQQVAWLTRRLSGFRVRASPETGSKITRAGPLAGQVEAGRVSMLRAEWNSVLAEELREFPTGRKDDQVDALSRAFSLLAMSAPAVVGRSGLQLAR